MRKEREEKKETSVRCSHGYTRRFKTRYVQIQCNAGTYSQTFFPSAVRLWNTLPVDICQLSPDSFKTHLNSFRLTGSPDHVLFLSSALHCFRPKLLFIVCCTAFWIHICLFTRGVILLGFESAPLLELGRRRFIGVTWPRLDCLTARCPVIVNFKNSILAVPMKS